MSLAMFALANPSFETEDAFLFILWSIWNRIADATIIWNLSYDVYFEYGLRIFGLWWTSTGSFAALEESCYWTRTERCFAHLPSPKLSIREISWNHVGCLQVTSLYIVLSGINLHRDLPSGRAPTWTGWCGKSRYRRYGGWDSVGGYCFVNDMLAVDMTRSPCTRWNGEAHFLKVGSAWGRHLGSITPRYRIQFLQSFAVSPFLTLNQLWQPGKQVRSQIGWARFLNGGFRSETQAN